MKKKIITILSLAVVLSLCLIIFLIPASGKETDYDEFGEGNITEKELLERLDNKNVESLLKDINASASSIEDSSLIYYADALKTKTEDVDDTFWQKEIMDSASNTEITKSVLIQIATSNGIDLSENKETVASIKDDSLSFAVRTNLLINYFKYSPSTSLLEELANGNDEDMAFQALRLLNMKDSAKAISIANESLESYKEISDSDLSIAIKVKALEIRNQNQNMPSNRKTSEGSLKPEDVDEFISICDYVLNERDDELLKESAIYALSDALHENAITYIVYSKLIDNGFKEHGIDRNVVVLSDMLTTNPTDENIQTVLSAMEISPLNDLLEPLKAFNGSKYSEDINAAIDNINKNGNDSAAGRSAFELR